MIRSFMTPKTLLKILVFLILLTYPVNGYSITNEADVKDIGVDEKLGETLPLDLIFYDEDGNQIVLEDLFQDGKPLILSLAYYSCPRICSLAMGGISEAINGLSSLTIGKDFKIATISFNPIEKPELAKERAIKFRNQLNKENSIKDHWLFLTGEQENITNLTKAVGFNYKKDGVEFAHPSTLIFVTPEATISRYLYGVQYEPKEVKLSLLEASDGKIGSSEVLNKILLFCYQFDPIGKRYALQALKVVKAGGIITLLSLGLLLTYYWKRERK